MISKQATKLRHLKRQEEALHISIEKIVAATPEHPLNKIVKEHGSLKAYLDLKTAAQMGVNRLWAQRKI